MSGWSELEARLTEASGADVELDRAIADGFKVAPGAYTASVEDCRALLALKLPQWRPHLGFDASGVFPYAALNRGERRHWAAAPTVPLAILRAAARVMLAEEKQDREEPPSS